MKSMLASMAVLTFCATPGAAAEFPKTGEAEYDMYYVDNVVAKIDSGAGTGAIVDITGITRNVKGEGPFHDMSVRCLGHQSLRGNIKVSQERFPTLWWSFNDTAGGRPANIVNHKATWEIK